MAEEITARIYNAPRFNIERNAKLAPLNRNSKLKRDIDVLLSSRIISRPSSRRAIECKNLDEKVDVEKIDAFVGKLLDVGIPHDHGIYVSTSGYTRDAIDRASPAGIKLLTLTGLTEDRLDSVKSPASQFSVFYLAQVTGFTVTNNVQAITKREELISFYDEAGELCGTILDLIWNRWQEREPKSEAGEYSLSLKVPAGWHQVIDGKREPVLAITASVQVWALVVKFTGTSTDHTLIDAVKGKLEKRQVSASFDIQLNEKAIHSLHTFKTENELKTFINEPKGVRLTIRTRLPRIQWMDYFFYPFSVRVARLLKESMKDTAKGDEPPALNIFEVEGSDLRAMWEPLSEGYPGKVMPVVITNEKEDGVIDVTAMLRGKQYNEVIALRDRLRTNTNPMLAEVIHDAYIRKGGLLLEESDKRGGAEAKRLLNRAKEQVEMAIRIKPDSAGAFNNLGLIYKELKRYKEAIAYFDHALAIDPNSLITWTNRAEALIELGRIDDSVASYERALALQPDHFHILLSKGDALQHLGRFDEAVASYDSASAVRPTSSITWARRGQALFNLKRFVEAATSFERACTLDPKDWDSYVQLAFALMQTNEIDRALESANAAVALAPTESEKYFPLKVRSIIHHLKQMHDDAMCDLLAAWKLNPEELMNDTVAHGLIGAVYTAASKSAETILMLAEMEWTVAAAHASAGEESEARRVAEHATGALESLVVYDDNGKFQSGGIMSGEVVTGTLTRSAHRLANCGDHELAHEHIGRMNAWVSKIYGDTLTLLDELLAA